MLTASGGSGSPVMVRWATPSRSIICSSSTCSAIIQIVVARRSISGVVGLSRRLCWLLWVWLLLGRGAIFHLFARGQALCRRGRLGQEL